MTETKMMIVIKQTKLSNTIAKIGTKIESIANMIESEILTIIVRKESIADMIETAVMSVIIKTESIAPLTGVKVKAAGANVISSAILRLIIAVSDLQQCKASALRR